MKKLLSLITLVAMMLVMTSADKKKVTLFMVGDSTMADKTELEISPERGWGQLFPTYLTDKIVVQNHAMNGRSTKSFQDEGRWQVVLNRISKGDIVILQFGHNDQKISDPTRYASIKDYQTNLAKMTLDAQSKGATVILATPINRRKYDDKTGDFVPQHGAYPYAVRMVAKAMHLPLLDLEESTGEWMVSMSDEQSKEYFMNVTPGECKKFPDGKIDNTHLRENGALAVGKMAANMIVDQHIKPLCKYIILNPDTIRYTTFCRPDMKSDKTVKVESDLKTDIK